MDRTSAIHLRSDVFECSAITTFTIHQQSLATILQREVYDYNSLSLGKDVGECYQKLIEEVRLPIKLC
jgi:hypothetical protein